MTNSKSMLEKELQEVITLTSTELEEYQEKVLELEDEVNIHLCCSLLLLQVFVQGSHIYPVKHFISFCGTFVLQSFNLWKQNCIFHSFKSPGASRSESES